MEERKPKSGTHKTGKSTIGSTRTSRRMLIIMLVLAMCITLFLVALYPLVMKTSEKEVTIFIPAGATTETVNDSLNKYFGEDYTRKVMRLAQLRGTDFSKRHGAYHIPKGTNPIGAMRKITSGAQTPVRITINGFRSLPLLIDRVSRKMEFPADSLEAALNDTAFLEQYGLTPKNVLALFVDDTYELYWSATARELVSKIGENYLALWNDNRVRRAAELGLTPAGVMIIASIVDEETNDRTEKGTIGRLYINRLNKNMRLQADPTVRFAVGDFTIRRITQSQLKKDSPYNTYRYAGLPPGPIRTTGYETVNKILDSEPNNYLYMCAKEDFSGSHNFSETYAEHLENATRYQAALDRKGIKR